MASKGDCWAVDLRGLEEEDAGQESFLLALACSFMAVAISIADSVAGSFFHSMNLWACRPKRSLPHIDFTISLSLSLCGRSTPADSRTEQRPSMCKCVKSSVPIIAESCDMSCVSRMAEFILWRSKSSLGAISLNFPGQQQTVTWGLPAVWSCKTLPEPWMKDLLSEKHKPWKPITRRSIWRFQHTGPVPLQLMLEASAWQGNCHVVPSAWVR